MELRSSRKYIHHLPLELQETIFEYLRVPELLRCRQVSTEWNNILSSSRLLWSSLCKNNGIVYTEGGVVISADKCKRLFFLMKHRTNLMKSGLCFSLESVSQLFPSTYFRSYILEFHCHEKRIAIATGDRVIRIYNANRIPQRSLIIKLFKFMNQPCSILKLRMDDTNIVLLDKIGRILAWDVNNGRCVAKGNVTNAFSFDLLKGTLIVACGLLGCVKIIDLIRVKEIVAETSVNSMALDVVLARHWSENQESLPQTLLLFCMDNCVVSVHKIVNFTSGACSVTRMYTVSPQSHPLIHVLLWTRSRCLRYDGSNYLYFQLGSSSTQTSIICKFNIRTGEFKQVDIGFPVHQLLGAGRANLVFTAISRNSRNVSLHAIDTSTSANRITCLLTSDGEVDNSCFDLDGNYILHPLDTIAAIAETGWLDGLNGLNDVGFICAYMKSRNNLNLIRWLPR